VHTGAPMTVMTADGRQVAAQRAEATTVSFTATARTTYQLTRL
jgi:hypothetical protein